MSRSIRSSRYKWMRERLVSERRNRGMTQADLAVALRRPQSFVSKIESGERRIDVIELLDVLVALGVSPTRFISNLTDAK